MGRGRRPLNPLLGLAKIPPGPVPWGRGEYRPDEVQAENSPNFPEVNLSLLEKYLIRNGWTVRDQFDAKSGRVLSEAFRAGSNAVFTFPKPTYNYIGQDRGAELELALGRLGELEQAETGVLIGKIMKEPFDSPEGFSCKLCGQCCYRMRDAYQGLVSMEEVDYWRSLGLRRVLNLISMEERDGYVLYAAWKKDRKSVV